jgi:hypothetical protein
MEAAVAREIAFYSHYGERTGSGELMLQHVERVAAAVPPGAQVVAWLHDVLEHSTTDVGELIGRGLTETEREALDLLTCAPGESFELHALRIAYAPGPAGTVARAVKLADLDDHLAHDLPSTTAPPRAWARRHMQIAVAGGSRSSGDRA